LIYLFFRQIAFTVSSCGEFIILCVIQGMLAGLHADDNIVSNTKALSAATAFSGGIWLLVALPWFVLEKHRPGRKLPPGTNVFTAGIILAWSTLKQVWHLKQTLLYLCF
jgi:MFS-type transporter involved in bile tolerance (Atg22 family)